MVVVKAATMLYQLFIISGGLLKNAWAHSCNVQQELYIKKGGARAPASPPLNPPLKSIIIIVLRLLRLEGTSIHDAMANDRNDNINPTFRCRIRMFCSPNGDRLNSLFSISLLGRLLSFTYMQATCWHRV